MELNDKKLQQTRKFVNWGIAILLGAFLIALSNAAIEDMDGSIRRPIQADFLDYNISESLKKQIDSIDKEINKLYVQQENIEKMIQIARKNKNIEQESFDNWIKTRSTLGRPDQDQDVLARVAKLDDLLKIENEWQDKWNNLEFEIKENYEKQEAIREKSIKLDEEANHVYEKVLRSYDLKVFLIRLAFVGPVLALGIFFFFRYRKHKFSPLFMGFTIFSLYAFFFGLVPYLPSYGGYIRYTVGVLLTIGGGYYAIKKIQDYSVRKKQELEASSKERANRLAFDITEKAYHAHICPSCGKDFLLKNWEVPTSIDKDSLQYHVSVYCRYCGLQLLNKCHECGHTNYAHLPYCVNCGTKVKSEE